MLADTDAIRALGSASSALAADFAAIAARMSTLPTPAVAALLGPVGARFSAALADATTHESRAVAALGDSVLAAYTTAQASAAAYDAADHRVGTLVDGV